MNMIKNAKDLKLYMEEHNWSVRQASDELALSINSIYKWVYHDKPILAGPLLYINGKLGLELPGGELLLKRGRRLGNGKATPEGATNLVEDNFKRAYAALSSPNKVQVRELVDRLLKRQKLT
jgi:hypothetical protein